MANEITPPEPILPITEKRPRRSPLWRLFGWGSAASLALAAVAFTSQTEAGGKRLRLALAFDGEPAQAVAALPRTGESDVETRRLIAQVRELTADRDRLTARIATLEHSLDDMTGSINRQSEQIAAARTAAPAPAPSAPATVAAPPPAELPFFMAMRMPQAAEPPQPPQQAEALPPTRVAAATAKEPEAAPPGKGEFAIDLGGAATIEALRIHWAGLKANYGPLLDGLSPRVTERAKQPSGVTYRLVVGPLANAEEAARLCARFPPLRTGCHPAKFAGGELAAH